MEQTPKYTRGQHPNSISNLETGRVKSLETRRRNKEIRLMKIEQQRAEKQRGVLDLELEIFKIRKKREEDERYKQMLEASYKPLSKTNMNLVIRNVFNM